jgi:hypothetical protein
MAVGRRAAVPAIVALLAAAISPPVFAQKPIPETVGMMEAHRLRIGDYVRAWPNEGGPPIAGTIVAVGDTTITVTTKQDATLLDLSGIHHMLVRHTKSHVRRAALIGASVGLVAGLLLVTEEITGHPIDTSDRILGYAAYTAGGAVLGASVGLGLRKVTWQPVDLVTLKPQPAARLSWTIRF